MYKIKELRKKKGLSVTALSKQIGISQSFLTRLENGERDLSMDMAVKLANAIDVSLLDILESNDINTLSDARSEIDRIDKEMALLYSKRLAAVLKVKEIKKKNGIGIEDTNREIDVIENGLKYTNPVFQKEYTEFIKFIMTKSKELQKDSSKS